jgi:two-component system sensor histidine kinase DegS
MNLQGAMENRVIPHLQSLDDVVRSTTEAIHSLEDQLAALNSQVEEIKSELDSNRARVQRDREEMDIEYSLAIGSQSIVPAPESTELRAHERALTDQAIRAASLHHQFIEFMSFIATSARQFSADGELLALDVATQAAIRSAAISAQETERHRLAREIHDGPAQALANSIIALEFVERAIRNSDTAPTRPLEEVERIKSSLREGLTEIRRFIFDLRPSMLQDRGLVATIEHYIATYQSLFPMTIDFHPAEDLPQLSVDQELTAFRVIQEAIQNARKHARATTVDVQIKTCGNDLVISAVDNGRGFSPERVTTHLMGGAGLKGMQERAALVGGTISIESAPGEGTRVELQVPLLSRETTTDIDDATHAATSGRHPDADGGAEVDSGAVI